MSGSPISVVHVASGDLWAGAEVQLHQLACALHARGDMRLHLVVLNHGELERRLHASGLSVEVLDERRLGPVRLFTALHRRLRQSGARVVHSHRYKENLLAALAARGTGCVAVRSIHSAPEPPSGLRGRAVRLADTLSARWQQAGICVSPELPERIRGHYPRLPLEVIENGLDYDRLDATARAPVDDSLLGDALRVVFVGRLVPVKRPDLFVAAAHQLTRAAPGRFSFHLFGAGPLEGQCREFITRHALDREVRLLGFRPEMPAWLARCDILVLCSDHEGLPMVLLEAMGLGLPVVAHAVGAMPHVLQAGRYGRLVRDHSASGYAKAILAVADSPAVALRRARDARAHARSCYSVGAAAERYVALYRRLLGAPVDLPSARVHPSERHAQR